MNDAKIGKNSAARMIQLLNDAIAQHHSAIASLSSMQEIYYQEGVSKQIVYSRYSISAIKDLISKVEQRTRK